MLDPTAYPRVDVYAVRLGVLEDADGPHGGLDRSLARAREGDTEPLGFRAIHRDAGCVSARGRHAGHARDIVDACRLANGRGLLPASAQCHGDQEQSYRDAFHGRPSLAVNCRSMTSWVR